MASFCDSRCSGASGSSCDCQCLGRNHGASSRGDKLEAIDRSGSPSPSSLTDSQIERELFVLKNQAYRVEQGEFYPLEATKEAESIEKRKAELDVEADKRSGRDKTREIREQFKAPVEYDDGQGNEWRFKTAMEQWFLEAEKYDDDPRLRRDPRTIAAMKKAYEKGKATPATDKALEAIGIYRKEANKSRVYHHESNKKVAAMAEEAKRDAKSLSDGDLRKAVDVIKDHTTDVAMAYKNELRSRESSSPSPRKSSGFAEERDWNNILFRLESTRTDKASADAEAHFARKEGHYARVVKRGDSYGIYTAEKR